MPREVIIKAGKSAHIQVEKNPSGILTHDQVEHPLESQKIIEQP